MYSLQPEHLSSYQIVTNSNPIISHPSPLRIALFGTGRHAQHHARAAQDSVGPIGKAPLMNQESLSKQMGPPLLRMSLSFGKR